MKKRNTKLIVKCIFLMILTGAVLPLLTDWFIFGNSFPSSISNSDWSGFLGSLWGGIIGGIGTLISIYISTTDVKESQELEKRNNKLERIINSASLYWKEAKVIEKLLLQKNAVLAKIKANEEEISGINGSLRDNPGMALEKRKGLVNELTTLQQQSNVLTNQLESLSSEFLASIEKVFYEKMILHILLDKETGSKDMLSALDVLDSLLKNVESKKQEIDYTYLNQQIDIFYLKTKDFLARYEK